jgi:3-oxoacyl-[acyl-carrier-protein] synthase-3
MTHDDPASPRPSCRSLRGVRILATGGYVPEAVVTNEHLMHHLGCDPEWIVKQMGIHERRHALPHQATSDLCYEAARRCLDRAGAGPDDVDLLLVATITPDMSFPSAACLVQDRLGLRCPAVDLGAACAGFMYALVTGAAYVVAGAAERVLIVAGDCMSRVANPKDVKTYPLLGDGAGAVLLARGGPDQGLLSYSLGADGSGANLLGRRACGSRLPPTPEALAQGLHYLHMNGRAVFSWAVAILADTIQDVLGASGLGPGDIDLYVPHQANVRILNAALDVLGVPRGLVFTNIERYGNTSAASVPLALDEALADDRIRPGDRLLLSGFGAGLAWGTAVFRW